MHRIRLIFILLAAIGFLLPMGCKPAPEIPKVQAPAPPPPKRAIVFLTAHGESAFEAGQRQWLARTLANDARLTLQVVDGGTDSGKQAAQFDQAAAAKPLAIIVQPLDAGVLSSPIRAAVKSGILVIGLGEKFRDAGCTSVLSWDETELGIQAGKIAVEVLTQRAKKAGQPEVNGRLVEIRGDEASAAATKRHEGLMEALKAAPGIILVHDAPGDWTQEGGRGRMQDALRLQQSFDVVYAQSDVMAQGAAQAAGAQRKDVFIIGTGGQSGMSGGLAMMVRGEINATVYQPLLVDFALELIRKKMAEPAFQLKPAYGLKPRAVLPESVTIGIHGGAPAFPTF